MALSLKKRDNPAFNFRRELPAWLGKDGQEEPCFIEFDMRAAGSVNPEYMAAVEDLILRANIMDAKVKAIEDTEARVRATDANARAVAEARLCALYDTCVIDWRSDIYDGDTVMDCTRANFVELLSQRVPEIAQALLELEKAAAQAGKDIIEADAATVKN